MEETIAEHVKANVRVLENSSDLLGRDGSGTCLTQLEIISVSNKASGQYLDHATLSDGQVTISSQHATKLYPKNANNLSNRCERSQRSRDVGSTSWIKENKTLESNEFLNRIDGGLWLDV